MVEVTKDPRTKLFEKIRMFEADCAPKIKEQLAKHKVVHSENATNEWKVGLWVFVPRTTLTKLEGRMRAAGVKTSKVTALEDTMVPTAWDSRFR